MPKDQMQDIKIEGEREREKKYLLFIYLIKIILSNFDRVLTIVLNI